MTDIIAINVTSLKVIRGELNVTLEHAARHFETYVSERNNIAPLKETLHSLTDLTGIFKLLQLPGTLDFVESMLELTQAIIAGNIKQNDFVLSALSHAYVGLPCYIEYLADTEQAVPALILPFTNELRTALRKPIVLESQLNDFQTVAVEGLTQASANAVDDLKGFTARQRQMFQLGLIGLLREENLELKIQLMHRAMLRMASSVGGSDSRAVWRMSEAVLEGFLAGDLNLNFTRKRVLSLIDAALRQFHTDDSVPANRDLLTELAFLTQLAAGTTPAAQEVFSQCALSRITFTDKKLSRERDIMQGPNAETIVTMVAALRDELSQTKEVLEIAAQDASGSTDLSPLLGLFQRTGDILSVVGLTSASNVLSELKQQVATWVAAGNYDRDQLLDVADGLLYVESSLTSLSRLDLDFIDKNETPESKMALMAKSQLDEAQRIVLKEALAGILLAKKDISSFVESNFDMIHIANIAETLISVRGGVSVLKLDRAAAVLKSCAAFIENLKAKGLASQNAENVLETMADALISLEYYLSELELHHVAPPNVLEVAEKSLAALGFPVQAV
ncbi:MAG: hypothetical protein HRU20_23355 [Pseudomonadales bacterium]|nr:hypothetical protein [Pseudomonadales bacterium]